MATRTKGRSRPDVYLNLIRRFPLRPIRSEAELDQAIQMVDSLIDRDDLGRAERDYLDVLSDQVERYETEVHPLPPVGDAELLQHLLEAKGVTQIDACRETGIAESTLSEVLSGKRKLNRTHIGKLCRYFHVEPGAFFAS